MVAGQEPPSDEQRALDLFMQAEQDYEAGRVRESLELLLRARELHMDPVLLFNIARAHETLGELALAKAAYQEYLVVEPDAPDRGAIEIRIAAIDQGLSEQAGLQRELDSMPVGAPNRVNHLSTVTVATGAATLGGALALGLLAKSARRNAINDPRHDSAAREFERGENLALGATILYVAGGVIAAAGTTWLIVELVTADADSEPGVAVGVGIGRATLQVTF